MGTAHPFIPEQLVVAALSSRPGRIGEALALLGERFGPAGFASEPVPWSFTTYYDAEMGPGIVRVFWAFERLVDPSELAAIKLSTNAIENEFREDGARKLNLDPGLLSLPRFVLATTKDRAHRIPLRDGVYAEVTLIFERGAFRPLPWTYPDFRTNEARALLGEVRDRYREHLGTTASVRADATGGDG